MTQPIGEAVPEVIAGNIEQEMLSTIEYMKRLDFDPQTGLDIYIVASGAIKTAIDQTNFPGSRIQIFTPFEVSQSLGIKGATQPTDQFGDVILAAIIGCSKQHILTLFPPQFRALNTLQQGLKAERIAAALAILGVLGYGGAAAYNLYLNYAHMQELQEKKSFQQNALNKLHDDIKQSNIDIESASDLMDLYQQMQQEKYTPLSFLTQIAPLLKPPVRVKNIDWTLDSSPSNKASSPTAGSLPPRKIAAVFTLEFTGVTSQEMFKATSKKLLDEMKAALKDYDVSYTKLPALLAENDKTDMTFGGEQDSTKQATPQSSDALNVELTIRSGSAKPAPVTSPATP